LSLILSEITWNRLSNLRYSHFLASSICYLNATVASSSLTSRKNACFKYCMCLMSNSSRPATNIRISKLIKISAFWRSFRNAFEARFSKSSACLSGRWSSSPGLSFSMTKRPCFQRISLKWRRKKRSSYERMNGSRSRLKPSFCFAWPKKCPKSMWKNLPVVSWSMKLPGCLSRIPRTYVATHCPANEDKNV